MTARQERYRMAYLTRVIRHGLPTIAPRVPGPLVHGSAHAYNHRGCRCDVCRAANRQRVTDYRRKPKTWPSCAHGRNTTYTAGCRCNLCREAHAAVRARWKARHRSVNRVPSPIEKRADVRREYLRNRRVAIKAGTWKVAA